MLHRSSENKAKTPLWSLYHYIQYNVYGMLHGKPKPSSLPLSTASGHPVVKPRIAQLNIFQPRQYIEIKREHHERQKFLYTEQSFYVFT